VQGGYLLALDSTTLAVKSRALLLDPVTGTLARVSDDSTASPAVGPRRRRLLRRPRVDLRRAQRARLAAPLQRDADDVLDAGRLRLGQHAVDRAGGDGAVVRRHVELPADDQVQQLPRHRHGNGVNQLAVIDPRATQIDPISGRTIMKEVLTIAGPTLETGSAIAVKEWCINTAAVDPLTKSVLVNSEDGFLYRWDLATNRLSQKIQLTSGIGESYTPTAIGADGAVYAINNAVLFSIAK
jgi:hypothetical protein